MGLTTVQRYCAACDELITREDMLIRNSVNEEHYVYAFVFQQRKEIGCFS